ncbi:ATP-dependent zinc metalloprotease FtsH [uncultured Brevundimonas sp.]|uniref:ATP-dependent zinc metalloprotease FtsH n=1 Tax=uncultured Brevundimonas sp. TaxID=213418 RepID=UPI002638F576|nr:ATP-dependent zinc metalloprotease FtsH [uncultured Brevundimonas sp.]
MNLRNIAIGAGILLMVAVVYSTMTTGGGLATKAGAPNAAGRPTQINYTQLMTAINAQEIKSVTVRGDSVNGVYKNDSKFTATVPVPNEALVEKMHTAGIAVDVKSTRQPWWSGLIGLLLPVVLIIGFWLFIMNRMQGGSKGAMGFGKSKAKLLTEHKGRKTFADVAGVDEAKEELQEVVDFLKDPSKFQRLGGKIPKGALLVGPPGTGKTLLARAVAGEAGVPFFSISGSDFVEMFVGVGASRVRDMFEQAKKNAPCIIFIDEIDAVGRHRGAGLGGGNDEREQTLNQLLVEMDGFEASENIILIAATNRPDVLDPALLRPGRFDRQVTVPNPDVTGREHILRVHMKDVPLAADVNVKTIARGTPGFSGADLANLVNEAALMAARKDRKMVTQRDFEDAKDKVMMGSERKSMAMSEEEKRLTAYHEAGHAIVALNVKKTDPVHKATIVPRGRALGMVMQLPEGDRYSMSYQQMVDRIAILAGGRVAEELIFGKENITSGASSDIEQATKMARAMVTRWGYSEKLGTVAYGENQEEVFLGHSVSRTQNISEKTAQIIDEEVRALVNGGWDEARRILTEKAKDHEALAQALLEYETLSGDEIAALLKDGTPPNREDVGEPITGPSSSVPLTDEEEVTVEAVPSTGVPVSDPEPRPTA